MTSKHLISFATASAFVLACAATQPAVAGSLSDTVSSVTGGVSGGRSGSRGSTSGPSSSSKSGHSGGSHSGGHGSDGGINVKVKTNLLGGTSVKADALSKKGVANVKAKTGLLDTRAKVGVLNKDGVASAKVSVGSLKTRASVNVLGQDSVARLGVSIGGNGGGGNGGGGNARNIGAPAVNGGVLGSMSDSQIAALKVRCVDILNRPRSYDSDLVALCSLLQQI